MNWLDIVLIIVAAGSVIAGFKSGFVRAAVGLLAFIGGLLCGLWFYRSAAATLEPYISQRHVANAVAFCGILVAFLIVGAIAGRLVAKLLDAVHLSWLDRLLGGAFGLVRAALVAAVIVLAIMAFAPRPAPQVIARSRLAPYAVDVARTLASAAPYEVKQAVRLSYDRIKEIWGDAVKRGVRHLPSQSI